MSGSNSAAVNEAAPGQVLGLGDATAIIVGLIIGAGIFKAPSTVAARSGGEMGMVVWWIAGGLLSLNGAMC